MSLNPFLTIIGLNTITECYDLDKCGKNLSQSAV
jgi:hypothetical protein